MKSKPGPGQGERLKINGDWQSAVRKLANAPRTTVAKKRLPKKPGKA